MFVFWDGSMGRQGVVIVRRGQFRGQKGSRALSGCGGS